MFRIARRFLARSGPAFAATALVTGWLPGSTSPAAGAQGSRADAAAEDRTDDLPRSPARYRRISLQDGLAQGSVHAIVQDLFGFVWIATQDGLHRHDGHRFTVHRTDPFDESTLSHGFVQSLLVDRQGRLWAGTYGGPDRWSPETGRFERLGPRDPSGRGPHVTSLAEDPAGRVWAGTRGGQLLRFRTDDTFDEVLRLAGPDGADEIWSLAAAEGSVWVGTGRSGVLRMPLQGGSPEAVDGAGPELGAVHALLVARDGAVWAGTSRGGLLHLPAGGHAFEPWDRPTIGSPVWGLLEDPDGTLRIGTRGEGLLVLRPDGGLAFRDRPDPRDPWSLHEDDLLALFRATDGTLWVGTAFDGVAVANPDPLLHRLTADPEDPLSLPHPVVRAVLEDPAGGLWVGTHGGGLVRGSGSGFPERFRADPEDPTSLPDDVVWSLHASDDGTLWVGTETALARLDPETREFRSWRHSPDRPDGPGPGSVRAIAPAGDGSLWIGRFGGGLDRFDPRSGTWTSRRHDPTDPGAIASDLVLALLPEADGGVWIGTGSGLDHLSPDGVVTHYATDAADPASLAGRLVRSLLRSAEGSLWVGTDGGLDRLVDRDSGAFEHFGREQGLPNETVYAVLEDDRGSLWISTNRGISRLDPDTGAVRSFGPMDGLQGFEFNGGAAARDRSGRLWFGGVSGLNRVDPDALPEEEELHPIRISGLRRAGRPDREPPPAPGRELRIPHDLRVFTVELAVLDYVQPRSHRFGWRIEGLTSEWVELGSQSAVTFGELPPGRWALEVRGASHDGRWSEPARLLVRVLPPRWKTPWAWALYVGTAAGLLVAGLLLVSRRRAVERRFHRALAKSEQRLQLALVGSGDALWDWDLRTNRVQRDRMAELLGIGEEELPPDDAFRRVLVHPDDRERVEAEIAEHLAGRTESFETEYRIRAGDGRWLWILDRGNVVERDEDGRPVRMAGTCKDISRRRQMEDELRLWATVFRNITDGVVITDTRGRILAANQALCRMTGHAEEELEGRSVAILQPTGENRGLFSRIGRELDRDGRWRGELWQRQKTGGRFLAAVDVTLGRRHGAATHLIAVLTDITRRRQSEEQLRYLASYDPLTGLPNRTLFHDRLEHALSHGHRRRLGVALLFADLDRFKQINDSLGHAVGDLLLQRVANRLREAVRDDDTVARFGGDEFTVVLEEVVHRGEVVQVAERILAGFAQPFRLEDQEISVTPSLGISLYPEDGSDGATLLKHADTAMYQAKALGRGRFQFYREDMTTRAVEQLTLENRLRGALERDELVLHYQPRVRLDSGAVVGAEALLRWHPAGEDLRYPGEFLETLVETGLVVPVGTRVLRAACRQAVAWAAAGRRLDVAVNVSARQLTDPGLRAAVERILEDTGLEARRLVLEITESELIDRGDRGVERLRELRRLGVRIAIDDFGTGYSSLGYLKLLPADELKIDRSLIHDLGRRIEDRAILAAIVAMADALGLEVVAEGIETARQAEAVRETGCELGQGFYWAGGLTVEEWERLPPTLPGRDGGGP